VPSSLTAERVRRDVDVLARAGLDTATFLDELDESLRRAVPYTAACVPIFDPATRLVTGTRKFGDLVGQDEKDLEWGLIEYGEDGVDTFTALADRAVGASAARLAHGGRVDASRRMRELMIPEYDFGDELRLLAVDGEHLWAGMCMFRATGAEPFTEDEVAFVASLSGSLAVGVRSGLLIRVAEMPSVASAVGPAVVIVDGNDELAQVSPGAEERLGDLMVGDRAASPMSVLASLVAGARRYASGTSSVLPRSRARLRSGQWVVLHASPLTKRDGSTSDVVITIEEARPPEIVPLVVAAFDLTPRERDVTQLVLQGVETKEIAAALHLSAYTVQDHLKSVFEKADVRSRRELIARVFFDQYLPRLGTGLAPSGWFAPS
jgi:DNA-binding CsgD family transcriptional regulator